LWPNDMRVCQILHTGGGNLNAGKGGIWALQIIDSKHEHGVLSWLVSWSSEVDLRVRGVRVVWRCVKDHTIFRWHFFENKNLPGCTAYYFKPQIENLMIVMSLCWELLMGWRTWWLGLKLLRSCRRILLCRLVAGSLSN
jgi:hypothetical protein